MQGLKKNSIHIAGTIAVCWPQHGEEETIDMTDVKSKFNGAYSTNNSTICFVDGDVFVTPYTRQAMATINRAGLVKRHFYVPFSNGDYPKGQKNEWFCLREAARSSYRHDYEEDCAKWCDSHGISKLGEDILERCFKMPCEGITVKHNYEDVYYPIGKNYCTIVSKLGTYTVNNGRVVFVHYDGHTYVAKGRWIINELRVANYKETHDLFVPFSNGEQITDRYWAKRWEEIPNGK